MRKAVDRSSVWSGLASSASRPIVGRTPSPAIGLRCNRHRRLSNQFWMKRVFRGLRCGDTVESWLGTFAQQNKWRSARPRQEWLPNRSYAGGSRSTLSQSEVAEALRLETDRCRLIPDPSRPLSGPILALFSSRYDSADLSGSSLRSPPGSERMSSWCRRAWTRSRWRSP